MVFGGLSVVWSTVGGKCLRSAIAADCFVPPPEPPISMLGCFDVCVVSDEGLEHVREHAGMSA